MTHEEYENRVAEAAEKRRKLEDILLDYVERNTKADTTPAIAATIPEVAKVLIELLR